MIPQAQLTLVVAAMAAAPKPAQETQTGPDADVDPNEQPNEEPRNCPKGPGPVDCRQVPIARKGGDSKYTRRHNKCADKVTLDAYRAKDLCVKGKAFDGLDAANVLWEIKGHAYSYANIYKNAAMARRIVEKMVADLQDQASKARDCGYGFKIGVKDPGLMAAILAVDPNLPVEVVRC